MGLPITLAILERHTGDQQQRGRLGNLTHTGTLVISSLEKSKNFVIGFKMSGLPYTRYGPPRRTEILSSSRVNLYISHPEAWIVREASHFQTEEMMPFKALYPGLFPET
jgi:hypothetical protein